MTAAQRHRHRVDRLAVVDSLLFDQVPQNTAVRRRQGRPARVYVSVDEAVARFAAWSVSQGREPRQV